MPDDSKLIPVFVWPLATLLAAKEKKKGSPLDASEVVALRDRATCIMMPVAEAARMDASRGFRDVNPKSAWADWHRLRAQLTGGYPPRTVLCVPGNDDLRKACERPASRS
jgi:hypothetical protein